MMLWKIITIKLMKKEVNNMTKCYFRNLENGKTFSKVFDSPYLMNQFLTKCRYSKKIRCIGKVQVWG